MRDFSAQHGNDRSLKEIMSKWDNLKKAAKEKSKIERQEIFKTGGGVKESSGYDSQDDSVMSIIRDNIRPFPSLNGSDKNADISLLTFDLKTAKKTKLEVEKTTKKTAQNDALELATMAQSKKIELLELRIQNEKEIHDLVKRKLYLEIELLEKNPLF